jgi:hypothetical protein
MRRPEQARPLEQKGALEMALPPDNNEVTPLEYEADGSRLQASWLVPFLV